MLIRNYLCILLLLLPVLACRGEQDTRPLDNDQGSQLSSVQDREFSLFLSYGQEPGTYEFLSCDNSVDMALDLDSPLTPQTSSRPAHCVPAFKGASYDTQCRMLAETPSLFRKFCPVMTQLAEYCALRNTESPIAPPEGFSENDCKLVATLQVYCPRQGRCREYAKLKDECSQAGRPTSPECRTFYEYKDQNPHTQLTQAGMSDMDRVMSQETLMYEDFLAKKNQGPLVQNLRAFSFGSSMALFSKKGGQNFRSLFGSAKWLDKTFKIFPGLHSKRLSLSTPKPGGILTLGHTISYFLCSFHYGSSDRRCLAHRYELCGL